MRWRTRTSVPWRDVPERYGPWERILEELQVQADAKGADRLGRERGLDCLRCPPARRRRA
ncbi:hypothetical protein [Streptomyces sp. NPDC002671]